MSSKEIRVDAFKAGIEHLEALAQRFPELVKNDMMAHAQLWHGVVAHAEGQLLSAGNDGLQTQIRLALRDGLLEDVYEDFADQAEDDWSYLKIRQYAGRELYRAALKREAVMLTKNAVSPSQVAILWRDQGRPPLDGGHWDEMAIMAVLVAD